MKKILALVVAMLLVLGMTSAFAAALSTGTAGGDKTITITPPSGLADDASNTYTVYKVFDAVATGSSISYKAIGNDVPNGFVKDDANNVYLGSLSDTKTNATGEFEIKVGGVSKYITPTTETQLTDEQIAAIKNFSGKVEVGTVTITGTTPTTVTVPDYGYYYITTTTGTVVSINSTNKSASVSDKNTVPTLNKIITNTDKQNGGMAGAIDDDGKKALAELGRDVEYTATITVGKGEKGYVFHDKMGSGLTFKCNSSVTVTASPAQTGTWYTIKSTPDTGDTLTITFVDDIAEGTVITIKYIGTVNSDALTVVTGKNTAIVTYGDSNSTNHTPESTTNVYNAKLTVTKTAGNGDPLGGAGFVIKNAAGKYYKYHAATAAQEAVGNVGDPGYQAAQAAAAAYVEWVDSEDDATEYFSDATNGTVPDFTGLVNGTYTLHEKTVPTGYNQSPDSIFTINANNYDAGNLAKTATVINNSGSQLPSTGGIGTTLFYIGGSILVLAAVILLVTKRRMNAND